MNIKELIFDWKHWLGWILSTAAVVIFLQNVYGLPDFVLYILLLLIISVVDILKHLIKLQ